ncbi:MAG: VOC family protein [Acidimicrobiia bacterium]|nr:VOC family protein [Acidimicrobiia bacterium]
MRFGQINLYVADLDAATTFYTTVFGFEVIDQGASYRTLRRSRAEVTLFRAHGAEAAPARGAMPGMTADILVSDFDATVNRIRKAGGTVAEPQAWSGGRFALFADPDGISWELIEEPGD